VRRVLILVENLPSPFDRRVWQEACTLRDAGYGVSIVCPIGIGYESRFESLDGISIYRYRLPLEARGALGYALEYAVALAWTFVLAWRVLLTRGFDVIHACNPPDLLFLIGGFFKLLGKKFVFDHHDLCPELYEAKFRRRGLLYQLMLKLEYLTFRAADVSIATNESYRDVALERGRMPPERVFVVRSGPSLERLKIMPTDPRLRRGRRFLVGYVGVMGRQEGIDLLLRAAAAIVLDLGRRDVHFGLVGGGTSLDEMKALAAKLGIADYVTFTGRVPDRALLSMLNKPIVQFDLTEGRRTAREASLYARRNDAADLAAKLVALLDDPGRRAAMGWVGRRRVENELEWRHEAPKLLEAYASLWPAAVVASSTAT
jgi:glycosyltransferase involved in cell wall biosynthesis